ncbi:MAG: prolyl oligopeptidase family serine peptidase [Myxococcales bacterium]
MWRASIRGVLLATTLSLTALFSAFNSLRAEDSGPPADPLRARLQELQKSQPAISPGVFTSIAHLLDVSDRIEDSYKTQSAEWRARAQSYLDMVAKGEDPYPKERGRIVSRGYRSPISTRIQGYTVYVPPDYTPDKSWPLMIVLHGGSSNGNLFLGVVLGNNMNWKEYDFHLWDRYEPKWSPPWIVAAPDGYGQLLWRWMGEQDVLDVIDDISRHYNVDADRVVLSGLSNGGVGAYAVGTRHASRFSVVQAIAGAPSWAQYTGEGNVKGVEAELMRPWNAMDLAENWYNTDFRYYHGDHDPGPMKPAYVHTLDERLAATTIPHKSKWFEAGHDLLYLVHRHGNIYKDLAPIKRQKSPAEVHLVSGDYRAARQHWLEVTRIADYPQLARLVGKASPGKLEITTSNTRAFAIDLRDAPVGTGELSIDVDGTRAFKGNPSGLGHRVHLVKLETAWALGVPEDKGLVKRPGLSGPLTDAYYGRMIHVYGTQRPENAKALQELAKKGSKGWPMWPWTIEQEVVADSALTPEMVRDAHLVLYGTPGDNSVLDRLLPKLPIQVDATGVVAGAKRYEGKGVGTRFIYPNPESPERYVTVIAGPTVEGVRRGHNLPDFVPDYVIYDATSTAERPRLVPTKPPLARGFFGANWELK